MPDIPPKDQKVGRTESRKRQRESGSQTDEDCCSGSHCCETPARFTEMEMKITEMNVKLDKLLGLINEMEDLRTRLTEVENENKSLKEAMKSTNEEFEEMKTTSTTMCTIANKNTEDIQSLEKEVLMLKRRNIKLEAYTRRENIKIFNIAENEGEDRNTESLVRNVLREKMKIPKEDEEYIRFERIHRIATRKPSSKPRPIIAKFSHYQDKEFVWSFVKNLKGTNIGIANDFPKEIEEIQSKLYPVLKKAKKAKQSAFFKVDRLIINGQVYRGKETEDLEHYGAIM